MGVRDIALLVELRTSEHIQAQLMAPQVSTSVIAALAWIYRSIASRRRVFRVISVSRWRPGIGFLVVFLPETSDNPPLIGLAIRADQQGKGVGAMAMNEAIQLSKNMGFETVRLSVRLDNPRARKLYESLGFTTVSRGAQTYFQGTCLSETMELNLGNWHGTIGPKAEAS